MNLTLPKILCVFILAISIQAKAQSGEGTGKNSAKSFLGKIGMVSYQPIRLMVNIGKTDGVYTTENYGIELNGERRIANYLNYGVSFAYYRFETNNNGGFGDPYPYVGNDVNTFESSVFLSGYLPINALLGNSDKKNYGFFPHISAGIFFQSGSTTTSVRKSAGSQLESSKSNSTKAGFYNMYGIDYKFGRQFGVSVATQKFKNFWFGINFQI